MENKYCHSCGTLVQTFDHVMEPHQVMPAHCGERDCHEDTCYICNECYEQGNSSGDEIGDDELDGILRELKIAVGGTW